MSHFYGGENETRGGVVTLHRGIQWVNARAGMEQDVSEPKACPLLH